MRVVSRSPRLEKCIMYKIWYKTCILHPPVMQYSYAMLCILSTLKLSVFVQSHLNR